MQAVRACKTSGLRRRTNDRGEAGHQILKLDASSALEVRTRRAVIQTTSASRGPTPQSSYHQARSSGEENRSRAGLNILSKVRASRSKHCVGPMLCTHRPKFDCDQVARESWEST